MNKAADTEAITTATKAVLSDTRLQTGWPTPTPEPPRPESFKIPEWLGDVVEVVFWGGLVCLAIFLAVRLAPHLRDLWQRRRAIAEPVPTANRVEIRQASVAIPTDLFELAEALARQNRFIEAIHLLLLAAVERLGRSGAPLPAAWTGRELFRQAKMSTGARTAFGALLNAAERTHFGGRPADLDDYAACRAHYESFRGAIR